MGSEVIQYIWWEFGLDEFEDFQIDLTIQTALVEEPAIYIQVYQGQIGDVGFYFGLQSDVYRPAHGGQGKGLVFSRRDTRQLDNARQVPGGWVQSSGQDGDFIGVRKKYEWSKGSYRLKLAVVDEDELGVWYGFFILDYRNNQEDFAGSLRFPNVAAKRPRIKDGGGTWIEVYNGPADLSAIPFSHITVDGCFADRRRVKAKGARSNYSEARHSDTYLDADGQTIHLLFGDGVIRSHEKGKLF